MNIENKHLIRVKWLSPTNTKAARVKLISDRFSDEVPDAVTIGFRADGPCYTKDAAAEWLVVNGYTIHCAGETRDGYAFMVNEFISLADAKTGKRWHDGIVA